MTSETIDLKEGDRQQLVARTTAVKRPRLLYIDNLRIVLITAVIFYHAAIVYGTPGVFPYREGRAEFPDWLLPKETPARQKNLMEICWLSKSFTAWVRN